MNGNLIETKKSKITFEENDYYDNYHDPMISNPMRFDSMGQSSPASSFSNTDSSQLDGSKMRGQNEDNSNQNFTTNNQDNADEEVLTRHTSKISQEIEAKIKGYEGEACGECGNFTLVRNGTCMKCNTCGATSGCS